jgi:uroporphyrinogen III methyltransferase/synthase
VKFFWERLREKGKENHFPIPLKVCAIGPATANQLKEKGIRIDSMPKEYIAEAVLEGFERTTIRGKRILLARARIARDVLPKGLRKMGAKVDVVEVYRTIRPRGGSKRLRQLLSAGGVDGVTFTSSSTVNHFMELLKKEDWKRLLTGIVIACIGPVTAHTAEKWGMSVHIQPEEYTIPALTEAIARYFGNAK